MTLDLDHLSKLAEDATIASVEYDNERGPEFVILTKDGHRALSCGWHSNRDDEIEANAAYITALDPTTVQELIRLARLGMEKEPMLTTDDIPPDKRGSICLECDPPRIVKDSEVDHCERVHI